MKKARRTLFIYIVISIITLWALTWLISCEKEPVIQDIESNSVITYVVETSLYSGIGDYTYYCEYIDPELEEPQQIILSNLNPTWRHDVIAKGDIEQYHLYFRYYGYLVTDTNYVGGGICVVFLDSDFTQQPSLRVDFLINNEQIPDSCRANSSLGGFLYPREDGRDWNNSRSVFFSHESYEYYWDQLRKDLDKGITTDEDYNHHIYVTLERWFDEDSNYMGIRVKKD